MYLSRSTLLNQYQRDPEFRSSLISYGASVSISMITALLPFNLLLSVLVISLIGCYIATQVYGYRAVFTLQASLLGWVCGTSLMWMIAYYGTVVVPFLRYALVMAVFHFSEFVFTAITNRRSLQPDSFLLNHSREYWIAAFMSWTEFTVEAWLFPSMKVWWISLLGVLICLLGEFIRKTAMVHAGVGFTHRLALSKRPDHRLVTDGIYAYLRHPGYTGWFLWSVGTQIVMCNPLCVIAYGLVSWQFFHDRIYDEERDLISFFGQAYMDYQQRVWVGIPFLKGYDISS